MSKRSKKDQVVATSSPHHSEKEEVSEKKTNKPRGKTVKQAVTTEKEVRSTSPRSAKVNDLEKRVAKLESEAKKNNRKNKVKREGPPKPKNNFLTFNKVINKAFNENDLFKDLEQTEKTKYQSAIWSLGKDEFVKHIVLNPDTKIYEADTENIMKHYKKLVKNIDAIKARVLKTSEENKMKKEALKASKEQD